MKKSFNLCMRPDLLVHLYFGNKVHDDVCYDNIEAICKNICQSINSTEIIESDDEYSRSKPIPISFKTLFFVTKSS